MKKNDLLIEIFQALLKDPEVVSQPDWVKIIMVGEANESSCAIGGYSFNQQGDWEAAAPFESTTNDLLLQLRNAMAAESPTGRAWVSCLLRVDRDGNIGADFEYTNSARWAVTPNNLEQRIAEFAAMPV